MRIETERLALRHWRADDVPVLAAIESHPEVAPMIGGPLSIAEAEEKIDRYMTHWRKRGYGRWAVEDRETGSLVGRAGVMYEELWQAGPERNEIGWTIERSVWGRGYATEAALAAITDAFDRVDLEGLIAFSLPQNSASQRVMVKCGFSYQGRVTWAGREHVWYALHFPHGRQPPNRGPQTCRQSEQSSSPDDRVAVPRAPSRQSVSPSSSSRGG